MVTRLQGSEGIGSKLLEAAEMGDAEVLMELLQVASADDVNHRNEVSNKQKFF